ncbi:MAG: M23 family metallopeptidase [Myxococcales bacterium]|nr:M23 family metallopeptidase [Myxococcales bacterium]
MFLRRTRGLVDFLAAALCLWAAIYHTPVGAALRSVGGRVLGVKSSARPLLAYYSGGVYEAIEVKVPVRAPPPWLVAAELTPSEALGYGAWAAYGRLPPSRRAEAEALARRYGADPRAFDDPRSGPPELSRLLTAAGADLGSEDAAVLALFSGYEMSRYAAERARAEGADPTLEELARQLPPGLEDEIGGASEAMVLGTAYSLSWPVPPSTPITSPFGMRVHPTLGTRKMHTGVDLGVPVGTEVKAVAGGVVRRASNDAVNGKLVVVDHGRGVTTAYCHNSELMVAPGQPVVRGAVLAHSGNTGRSTGPHLHYQLELGNEPMDPLRLRPGGKPSGPELSAKLASERKLEVRGSGFGPRARLVASLSHCTRGAKEVEADATGSFVVSFAPSRGCELSCGRAGEPLVVLAKGGSQREVRSEPVSCPNPRGPARPVLDGGHGDAPPSPSPANATEY